MVSMENSCGTSLRKRAADEGSFFQKFLLTGGEKLIRSAIKLSYASRSITYEQFVGFFYTCFHDQSVYEKLMERDENGHTKVKDQNAYIYRMINNALHSSEFKNEFLTGGSKSKTIESKSMDKETGTYKTVKKTIYVDRAESIDRKKDGYSFLESSLSSEEDEEEKENNATRNIKVRKAIEIIAERHPDVAPYYFRYKENKGRGSEKNKNLRRAFALKCLEKGFIRCQASSDPHSPSEADIVSAMKNLQNAKFHRMDIEFEKIYKSL